MLQILMYDLVIHNLQEIRMKFSTFASDSKMYLSLKRQHFNFVLK